MAEKQASFTVSIPFVCWQVDIKKSVNTWLRNPCKESAPYVLPACETLLKDKTGNRKGKLYIKFA